MHLPAAWTGHAVFVQPQSRLRVEPRPLPAGTPGGGMTHTQNSEVTGCFRGWSQDLNPGPGSQARLGWPRLLSAFQRGCRSGSHQLGAKVACVLPPAGCSGAWFRPGLLGCIFRAQGAKERGLGVLQVPSGL